MNNVTIYFGAPGCGKTHELMNVLSKELERLHPKQVAFVSFTRKGAYEGRNRAIKLFNNYDADKDFPYFRTLHSIAYRAGNFTYQLIDDKKIEVFYHSIGLSDVELYHNEQPKSKDFYRFLLDLKKSNPTYCSKLLNQTSVCLTELQAISRQYEAYKKYNCFYSFEDMLEQFIERDEPLPVKVAFIDEAQDLTTLQWRFCEVAFRDCARVYIAGDDDQAVYEWSGADTNYFLGLKGKRIVLDQSYRLKKNVLDFADRVSNNIKHRVPKNFAPVSEGGHVYQYGSIEELNINSNESYYFLARTNSLLKYYTEHLKKNGYLYQRLSNTRSNPNDSKWKMSANTNLLNAIETYQRFRLNKPVTFLEKDNMYGFLKKEKISYAQPWYKSFDRKTSQKERDYYEKILTHNKSFAGSDFFVSTIHGVKGGEADNVVLMLDINETVHDILNSSNADPEFKVLFVALTRARKHLHLILKRDESPYSYEDTLYR